MLPNGYSQGVSLAFGTCTGSFPSMGQTVLGDLNKLFSPSPTGPLCTSDPCEELEVDAEDCDAEEEGAFSNEPELVEVEGADC